MSEARTDLKCVNLLYENKIFSRALYHLQQSNEKLAKGLLISIGFLTTKAAIKDTTIEKILGIRPKKPENYGHRILPSLLSDLEKAVPSIEKDIKFAEELVTSGNSEDLKSKVFELKKTIQKSEESIRKLKKRPSGLITNAEDLEREIKNILMALDKLDRIIEGLEHQHSKIDIEKLKRVIMTSLRKRGFKVNSRFISIPRLTKEETILVFKRSILTVISVGVASILDPLVTITRYPDSQRPSFDESNPYVIYFNALVKIISRCFEEASENFTETRTTTPR